MPDPIIAILPDNVANKIAAGEIVERPAAVVKELVENSLDAGGKHINIKFSRGGKFSMAVEDDGCGMSKDQALLSIRRHATSKLRSIFDLDSLSTFGFRGEALPSIGSVSKFKLITCGKNDTCGTEISVDGGKIGDVRDCAKFCGTQIIVENLFHNIPARRKFLKSDCTEGAHIVSLVKTLALAEHDARFSLFQDGNMVFVSPDVKTFGDRINAIFKHNEKFIDFHYSMGETSLFGAICDPTFANVCKKNIVSFVNNRLVKSDVMNFFLCDELAPFFPNHRGILAYIFLKIDPAAVDVNVHPMKREVRFKNTMAIRELVKNFVAETFGRKKLYASGENFCPPIIPKISPIAAHKYQHAEHFEKRNTASQAHGNSVIVRRTEIFAHSQATLDVDTTKNNDCEEWRFIGTMGEEISLFESATGLILFNVKLALRRITYEKIISSADAVNSQQLLIPIEISVPNFDCERTKSIISVFSRYGFSIYPSGKFDYKIDAIPPWLSYADAEMIVRDFTSDNGELVKNLKHENIDEILAKRIANAVGAENYRSQGAIETLRDNLLACRNPILCPLGNAIYFELPFCEINSKFHANKT